MGNITVKFTGHGTVRKALASLYFDQNTVYDAFSSFISQKCNELQKLQKAIGLTSHDLFDAIHQMMQGQVSTWTEVQVEEKLSGISCSGRPTSCGDQLAKACRAALEAQNA